MPVVARISAKAHPRCGISALEVLVAFTLLSSVLALSTQLIVQHGRLLKVQRDYRMALDELSNQLERIGALPDGDRSEALQKLTPSTFVAARLPGAKLHGALDALDLGQRLTLRLSWNEPQRVAAPVVMTAWILPRTENPPRGADEE